MRAEVADEVQDERWRRLGVETETGEGAGEIMGEAAG
jgi:hypothetical protein